MCHELDLALHVAEDKVELVWAYFDDGKSYVFTKTEMNNKIDLHAIRGQVARERYQEYEGKLRADPNYQDVLTCKIIERWEKHDSLRKIDLKEMNGDYLVCGENRKLAVRKGLPVV